MTLTAESKRELRYACALEKHSRRLCAKTDLISMTGPWLAGVFLIPMLVACGGSGAGSGIRVDSSPPDPPGSSYLSTQDKSSSVQLFLSA